MKTNKVIGFFGGSFSPPHYGHFLAACFAQKKYSLDEVWFCPTDQHALGKSSMDFNFRIKLCQALVEGFESVFKVSDIESFPQTDGKTYNTLTLLQKKNPNHQFKLVIGSDILEQKDQWYRFEEIRDKFGLCIVPRSGYGKDNFSIPNFSSTLIRRYLKQNNIIALQDIVSPSVLSLLKTREDR